MVVVARFRCAAWGLAWLLVGVACQREPAPSHLVAAPSGVVVPPSAPPAPSLVARETAAAGPSFGCDELPILGVYRAAGVVRVASARRVVLDLTIDLHSLDCGAPDGYGERLSVELDVEPSGERCLLRGARVSSQPFGEVDFGGQPWSDELVAEQEALDLAAPKLQKITLRGRSSDHALIIDHQKPWLFSGIKAGAPLRQELVDEQSDCCYGFTNAESLHWELEHYRSGFTLDTAPLEESERIRVNRWATNHGLRHQLELMIRRALELDAKQPIALKLSGSPAMTAIARIEQTAADAEERSLVLRFSRKPCETCRDGATGWWLWDSTWE